MSSIAFQNLEIVTPSGAQGEWSASAVTAHYAVSDELLDAFAAFSGDVSPIHMSARSANERGFRARVSHGAIHVAAVSQVIGVHLPGPRSLIHELSFKFKAPACVGDVVHLSGGIDAYHEVLHVAAMTFWGRSSSGEPFWKAVAQVGIAGA